MIVVLDPRFVQETAPTLPKLEGSSWSRGRAPSDEEIKRLRGGYHRGKAVPTNGTRYVALHGQ